MAIRIRALLSSNHTARRPLLLETRSSTWFITATVATAVFTDIFLYAVIVPVFPFSLTSRVGIPEEDIQHWLSILLSAYGAALLVSAPVFGWLSDRINSRRTMLLTGLLVLGGATVMLCLATNVPLLVLGRVFQGASAGVVWVVGLALLAETVGKDRAGEAMGYVALAYSLAALLAPLLGGIVYDKAGYYAVFAMAFGMIIVDVVLRLCMIEKKSAARWLIEQGVQSDVSNTSGGNNDRSISAIGPEKTTSADIEARAATGDEGRPLQSPSKRLPPLLILLKSRRMQATFWASTVSAMVFTVFDVALPLFVEETFHWSSLGAGLIFLALLLSCFIQPFYGWLVDRHGPRWIGSSGLLIMAPPLICLRFVTKNTIGHKVLLCTLLFMIGFGCSLTLSAVMAEFTYICAEKEVKQPGSMGRGGAYAQSYSLFNVSWAAGSLVGSYWAGGIKQKAGWGTMVWTVALLCAVVSVPSFLFFGGSLFKKKKRNLAVAVAL